MKKINIGILAHVDAGKTTLSEAMLYKCGSIKKLGRVDHQDAMLDYDLLERSRGITIYSKEVTMNYKDLSITLVDTPGHIDFSCEMERTLQVLDLAIVVISGLDGIQSHSETIFQLLNHYQVPTMIFINKMDISYHTIDILIQQIQDKTKLNIINFLNKETLGESLAMSSDSLLDQYMLTNTIENKDIQSLLTKKQIIPCFYGSALKLEGINELLEAIYHYCPILSYPNDFGAKVYKISYDEMGNRLSHVKITGGILANKTVVYENHKIDQIRIYQADKYEMVQSVEAGSICVLKGIPNLQAGQGLGFEKDTDDVYLTSYMDYEIILPETIDSFEIYPKLQRLQVADPQLKLKYDKQRNCLSIHAMGEVQLEVVKQTVKDLFNIEISFMPGQIIYKETIVTPIIGVGHFEPLRHYSEVQLKIEPNDVGKGIEIKSECHQDDLATNYQNSIIDTLKQNVIPGVLTGGELTDIKITLIAGKAHLKHTEGGDFYEATIRALRNGLYLGESILLEPYQHMEITTSSTHLSKIIFDMENRQATYHMEVNDNGNTTIHALGPIAQFQDYAYYIQSSFKGEVSYSSYFDSYKKCINQDKIVEELGYNPLKDTNYPCGSIFCSHGSGFYVEPENVKQHKHLTTNYETTTKPMHRPTTLKEDMDLETIFERTYGKVERRMFEETKKEPIVPSKMVKALPLLMFIDGYNIIHAWQETIDLVHESLEDARDKLIEMICDYQGYQQARVILVFDAYKVKANLGSKNKYANIEIIYTKEGQTADMYIERNIPNFIDEYQVIVASSDALVQTIGLGKGARRMSARELVLEYEYLKKEKLGNFKNGGK